MYTWARDLFPDCRSLTGDGVRRTLAYLGELIPELRVVEVPSGTTAFDWSVPNEWNIRGAYLEHIETGRRVVDFAESNLHVVAYSLPVDTVLTRAELEPHLHSIPDVPHAIPYITSFYEPRWGFCLTHSARLNLPDGTYRAVIDATLTPGSLTYGEVILPGREAGEVLLSTYVCHPSLANNELSGPVLATALARELAQRDRRWTYRIVFVPETIGSIVYISRHLEALRRAVIAGFVLTCVGDERAVSFMPSRRGGTLADRVAQHILRRDAPAFRTYSFHQRGSDERQYCSPGVDLPVCSVMRTKYHEYPEYHTSLDDLSVISPTGLQGAYDLHLAMIDVLEANRTYRAVWPCEPQLGKRNLYPTLGTRGGGTSARLLVDFLAYCDGTEDVLSIADRLDVDVRELITIAEQLVAHDLVRATAPTPAAVVAVASGR
jgi:aminopeptidase-like protein